MGAVEIVIIVLAVVVVVGVAVASIVRRAKGKSSCCSDCAGCPYAGGCAHGKNKNADCASGHCTPEHKADKCACCADSDDNSASE